MFRLTGSVCALPAALAPMVLFSVLPGDDQARPLYETDIAPILRAHCMPCHSGQSAMGGLSLDSFASLQKGGASGPGVREGDSKTSILMQRLLGEGGKPRMPMGFKPLGTKDLELVRRWIDEGAKRSPTGATRAHWAFVPPKKAKLPAGAANPIDAFIGDKLRRVGLKPSPPADRATLIRRVTLDLTGLPPTPQEFQAFLQDRSPNAYAKVVERLLASPHYGERTALPWLDAARYADSNGFQQDGDTFQYVWRDWVVRALNVNMPFDRFTVEQIAGDLLPSPTLDQLVATAFNRNHMLNGEGGAIPEEQRYVNLFDRVDTTSQTWLGLTMGCARCHDHKYDPLSQRDYYAMMAYFNQVPETGVPAGSGQYRVAEPWVYAGSTAEMAELKRAEEHIQTARAAATEYRSSGGFEAAFKAWRLRTERELQHAVVDPSPWTDVGQFTGGSMDEAFEKRFGPETGSTSGTARPELADGKVHALQGDNTAFYFQRTLTANQDCRYLLSLGSDDSIKVFLNGTEVFSRKATRGATPDSDRVVVELRQDRNVLVLKIVNGGGVGGFYFRGFLGGLDDAGVKLLRSGAPEDEAKLRTLFASSGLDPRLTGLSKAVAEAESLAAALRGKLPRVMVMRDGQARKTHILHRGNYEELTEEVQPATPKALIKTAGPPNRLGLARWIASPKNPLTARVQVNRAWQVFFGKGLVPTEENFGLKGEPPTHPELLDWLAVDFMEHGWNVKRLHRQIVASATYRQSSRVSPEALKKDPANRYYGRAPRFRLPSLILRDLALASSGLLDRRIGGKPVYPYQPEGIWDGLAITKERDFTYPKSTGNDLYRRSLYTFWRRTAAPGNMFDAGTRQVCSVKPTLTSSPLHALTMLNDVTWIECGAAMADSISHLPGLEGKLKEAFLRVCSRQPAPDELAVLKRSYYQALKAYERDPAAARAFLSQGQFRPRRVTPETAAMAAVCVSIYNLDEAVTRG